MSKRRISLILGLGVILAMGTTACGKHLPAESESEAINIQVVTREAAAGDHSREAVCCRDNGRRDFCCGGRDNHGGCGCGD